MNHRSWLISWTFLIFFTTYTKCVHVEHYWNPSTEPFKVVTRFGIQKFEQNHKDATNGYVFGNLTLLRPPNQSNMKSNYEFNTQTMLFVNRTLFKHIHSVYSQIIDEERQYQYKLNSSQLLQTRNKFCQRVYALVEGRFYDAKCNLDNKSSDDYLNFVRYVPCSKDSVCKDPAPAEVLPHYQFTYVIGNQKEPTKLTNEVHHNSSTTNCTWTSSNVRSLLYYDIWLVNGHPSSSSSNFFDFDHQFSFEQQHLFWFILLNLCYTVLLVIQLYILPAQKIRNLNYIFTLSLALQCLAFFFLSLHKIVFAHNGKGFVTLNYVAEVMKIMSGAFFMLFVLVIAKGWPITRAEIFSKTVLGFMWTSYTAIKIGLFLWITDSLSFIEEVDEYHTIPGWISLIFRIFLMMWFLHEIRHTMILEQDSRKLKFYLHFGAGMLVWFVHLPLVVLVALQIDLMWRYKIICGFSSVADLLAYCIVTRLMWQTRHNHFLSLDNCHEVDENEELEYYDEHNSSGNSETFKFTRGNRRAKLTAYDNKLICDNTLSTIKT